MHARYYPWGIAGGMLALAVPGTPLWTLPVVGALVHMVYDTDPAGWRENGQRLLTSARALPERAQQGRALLDRATAALPQRAAPAGTRQATRPRVARDPLLTMLDEQPHRILTGGTRSGKSTLMHTLATGWAQDGARVLVLDPDASPGQYPGCRVVGGGDNFEAIAAALPLMGRVIEQRRTARAQGVREFAPVHFVMDEAQDVIAELPQVLPLVETIARRGAKLNMHLTIGVQDKQVGTLGLEGKSELLRNFTIADVYRDQQGQRMVRLKDASGTKVSMPIPQLVDPETLIERQVQPQRQTQARPMPSDQALLGSLIVGDRASEVVQPVRSARTGSEASGSPRTGAVRDDNSANYTSSTIHDDGRTIHIENTAVVAAPPRRPARGTRPNVRQMRQRATKSREKYQQVRALVAAGRSGNEICRTVPGERQMLQALVRRAKAELGDRIMRE